MPMLPADSREIRSPHRLRLARPLRDLADLWIENIHLRRLATGSSAHLLRDIGLTAADLDQRLARLPGSNLSDRAEERSGNW